MNHNPDQQRGLYTKYEVYKREQWGSGIKVTPVEQPVFVLNYTKDPHARVALAAYAESCDAEFPLLAEDLRDLLEDQRSERLPEPK